MTDKAKNLRREYLKKWRKDHPGKNTEYNNNYWEKKAREAEAEERRKQDA